MTTFHDVTLSNLISTGGIDSQVESRVSKLFYVKYQKGDVLLHPSYIIIFIQYLFHP